MSITHPSRQLGLLLTWMYKQLLGPGLLCSVLVACAVCLWCACKVSIRRPVTHLRFCGREQRVGFTSKRRAGMGWWQPVAPGVW